MIDRLLKLQLVEGDLTELSVEAIVNPANSLGEMGGGVAGVIRKKGGPEIEQEAVRQAPIPIGKAVLTSAGKLPCRHVVHSPTMKSPAEQTDVDRVKRATKAALECADQEGLRQIAFPGMGTGVGRVDPEEAARAMVETARAFHPKNLEEVFFVAFGPELRQAFEQALKADV